MLFTIVFSVRLMYNEKMKTNACPAAIPHCSHHLTMRRLREVRLPEEEVPYFHSLTVDFNLSKVVLIWGNLYGR